MGMKQCDICKDFVFENEFIILPKVGQWCFHCRIQKEGERDKAKKKYNSDRISKWRAKNPQKLKAHKSRAYWKYVSTQAGRDHHRNYHRSYYWTVKKIRANALFIYKWVNSLLPKKRGKRDIC